MKKYLKSLIFTIGILLGLSNLSFSQQNYNFVVGGLSWSSGSSVPGACVLDGSFYWLNTGSKAWYVCAGGTYALPLATGSGAAFSGITGGTNSTAAMVVGTGASLATSGSGTIAATSAPFSGILGGTNTNSLIIGTGGSLTTSGSGTITATNGVTNQVLGQSPVASSATILTTTPGSLYISAFCQTTAASGYTSCPGSTNESTAIVAAETQCKNGGTGASSCYIVDDMCGTQKISVQPFTTAGKFTFQSNCPSTAPHVWSLDGIGTLTTANSGLEINGMGGNGFLQNPTNVFIQACNPVIDNCTTGFVMPNGTVSSTVVAGANMTVTLGTAIPITGNGPGVAATGRLLCIQGATTQPTNNGCWVINATTDTTHFVVGVVSGSTVSCTPGTCGTAFLDTPIMEIGASTGGGVFDVTIDNLLFNCHYVFGCSGFVNGVGQENTGFGLTHVSNTAVYYGRIDQSSAYNGVATAGATNSGHYGPWSGNINPELCTKTGGCSCVTGSGSGTTGAVSNVCTAGLVAVGGTVSCGAGSNTGTAPAVISPDPCDNPNFVGFALTGISGAQGFGEVAQHMTVSIADKSIGGGAPIPGLAGGVHNFGSDGCICSTGAQPGSVAATTGTGLLVAGVHASFGDTHFEWLYTDVEIGGNVALNATWEEFYGGFITGGVVMHAGLWAFQSGGVGLDIGQAGNGAFIQDIDVRDVNIGVGGGTVVSDNVVGQTCSDNVISWHHMHGTGTQASVITSCTTVPQVQILTLQLNGATSGNSQLSSTATGGTVVGPAGSTTVPGYGFTGSLTTGISAEATNVLGLLSNGVLVATITGGIELTNAASFKFSQTGSSNGASGIGIGAVGSSTTEAMQLTGTSTQLLLMNACKLIANGGAMSTSGTPVAFCTFTLPNSAQTWAWKCNGTYTTSTATDTFALGVNAAQTPAASSRGEAIIGSSNAGVSTNGGAAFSTSGANNIFTGASVSNVTDVPFEFWGTIQASATSGTFALTGTLTGTTPNGTVNNGTTCQIY